MTESKCTPKVLLLFTFTLAATFHYTPSAAFLVYRTTIQAPRPPPLPLPASNELQHDSDAKPDGTGRLEPSERRPEALQLVGGLLQLPLHRPRHDRWGPQRVGRLSGYVLVDMHLSEYLYM